MIVHGLWIGSRLSRLELLTLKSFVRWGHEFHLWLYDDLDTPVPRGVHLRDACEILPRDRIFRKRVRDAETGVGEGSVSPFSDLFRYKLLYEHGGVWVDMDITCLRPFDFKEDFVFRPHRLGMIGNLMKCPKGSELMRACYEESDLIADEHVDWLAQVRILNKHVERLGLSCFIRSDISNSDSWYESVRQFVDAPTPIPDRWYAIHWVNEFWRTLTQDEGHYRGRKVMDAAPNKDEPPAGGTLHELYRWYGLVDPRTPFSSRPPAAGLTPEPIRCSPRARPSQLNVILPALVRGGAERTVVETIRTLSEHADKSACVYVMGKAQKEYAIPAAGKTQIHTFDGDWSKASFRKIALEVSASPTPLVFAHLIRARHLAYLWESGVATVPVVHNARAGWLDPPTAYNDPHVPFVVAVAESVAEQLRESGCTKPIVTIRHELQRWFNPEEMSRARRELRNAHGVTDDTLLIGMVGQFKSQKAYTRAVRVLADVQGSCNAKLMILGDWDHAYGSGRTTYEATCRLALELGVMPDLIMPGNVHPVDPYFGAFDVYLNTSVYEGLSIALLEAVQSGCPVVAANAGGNREAMPDDAVLVEDPSDIDAYVAGVLKMAGRKARVLRIPPIEPHLIPQLWLLLAKHGVDGNSVASMPRSGTLFVTQGLHIGGPARSLTNLLTRLPQRMKTALCVLGGISVTSFRTAMDEAQVPMLELADSPGLIEQADQLLTWFDQLNLQTICLWNVRPETKLVLAKILAIRNIRLIDVSPGPMLFDELEAAKPFQRRLALDGDAYLSGLDDFVSLYADGAPSGAAQPRSVSFIPLGPAPVARFVPLPPPHALLPIDYDPRFAIGTCCRIVPDKKIEFLIEMMAHVSARIPGASLTIVGASDMCNAPYRQGIMDRVREERLDAIRFVGPYEDVTPFLAQFKVFVMVSERQGCPNASLEAMAMGLPVVANANGGTAEQVEDGVTGYLADDPIAMAMRVVELLEDPQVRRAFGQAGRARVRDRFGLDDMVARYVALLDGDEVAEVVPRTDADIVTVDASHRGVSLTSVAGGRN